MTAVTATKTGVTDTAAGAGVNEYLGLKHPDLAALVQACGILPIGDPWQIKASLSYTPTIITDTFPPSPVMAWQVPAGKALLFTGGVYHCLVAATDYVRVCRRYFLRGVQRTAAPSAPAAPAVAALIVKVGMAAGTYSYKAAPIDTFRKESAATVASANQAISGIQGGITVTPAAAPVGAIGYNIYRTLVNQHATGPWYYVGTTFGATAYIDVAPDSELDTALVPNATWAAGEIAGETMDGPGEIIIEVGGVAVTTAPATLVFKDTLGRSQGVAVTWPTAIGARLRAKLFGETAGFVPVPTIAANLWRGPGGDVRTKHEKHYGAIAVTGDTNGSGAGAYIIWGQQVIGTTHREEATAGIKSLRIEPLDPHGVLIPPLGEIVVEVGALAAGVAAVRDIALRGLLIPTAGT